MAPRSDKPRNKTGTRVSDRVERGPEGATGEETPVARVRSRAAKGAAAAETRRVSSNGTIVKFGREVCGNLDAAETREWIVTNGIGGFASGTVAGCLTRRYHGLLIAALQPPVGRTQLVANLD